MLNNLNGVDCSISVYPITRNQSPLSLCCAGAVKYLAEHFDLSKVPVVGASGGALAAVLLACGIDPDKAFDKAYQLASEHEIWTKPRGLFGIWGELIKEWLRFLLPPDAADICRLPPSPSFVCDFVLICMKPFAATASLPCKSGF